MLEQVQQYSNNKEIERIYDSWSIDPNQPLENQTDDLTEDIIQVVFRKDFILDIGWYPDGSYEGSFNGVLINKRNWDSPLHEIKTIDCKALMTWITLQIDLVLNFKDK